ncbi:MAG TPA: DNA repair protein RadA [Candidatus Brocadiia bacterium]|nr:DNA repair protein RadA [Candidatus Brocadiia bacterium]
MAKARTVYVCRECGAESPRWTGRCNSCQEWDTLEEKTVSKTAPSGWGARNQAPTARRPISLSLDEVEGADTARIPTGIEELDRALGGGCVRGGTILIGGDPGIGKSTLLLQMCQTAGDAGLKTLYASGEESPAQIKLRAKRLGVATQNLRLLAETDVELIAASIAGEGAELTVVDSIQTVFRPDVESPPGSVSQLRECAGRLINVAKSSGSTLFLVGHVTKQGAIAGPKMLEHMVDTVLYFEGEQFHSLRVLRTRKNRFGSTDEVGVFEMTEKGLMPIANPSEVFLSYHDETRSGSVVLPTIEGSRAILVEVQALLSRGAYGMPERKVSGMDYNRVCMLLAVLQRKTGSDIAGMDIFVNVAGGVRIREPASDAAACLAMVSSLRERPLKKMTIAFGEVGLAGELRGVNRPALRLREAEKMGFKRAIIPTGAARGLPQFKNLEIIPVSTLADAITEAF